LWEKEAEICSKIVGKTEIQKYFKDCRENRDAEIWLKIVGKTRCRNMFQRL
jgi:hypothetical protein